MALYTPRGLKIRLPVPYAFALLARIYPRAKPYAVLKTTEALDLIPDFLSYSCAIVCFALQLAPLHIFAAVVGAHIVGILVNLLGFYLVPGLVAGATAFSYLSGFGLLLVLAMVLGYVRTGWPGILAYLVAIPVEKFLGFLFELLEMKVRHSKGGPPITRAEINFFNAYRLHAVAIGKTKDLGVEDDELSEQNWRPAYLDLATSWPQVVARFTPD